jgi:hypothetical protein
MRDFNEELINIMIDENNRFTAPTCRCNSIYAKRICRQKLNDVINSDRHLFRSCSLWA